MRSLYRISLGLVALCAAAIYSVQPAKAQFSGCGAGVFGGGTIGTASIAPIPFDFALSGWAPGVTAECGWKFGQMYLGAGAEYSWQKGDLDALVKNDLTVFAKAGVIVTNTTMIYAHAGWSRLSTIGPDVDGWKVGLGSETKLGNTPLYLDLRYTYAIYDADDISPGLGSVVDLNSHNFRVGFNVKLGPGMFGQKGPMFVNEDYTSHGCDPKIDKGCKK